MTLDYTLVPQIGAQGRAGLIVLRSDETIEAEMRSVLPAGDTALFTTRIDSAAEVSKDSLAAMRDGITGAAALLPEAIPFDVVGYGCTSASSVIGTQEVARLVGAGCTTARVTDPISGLVAACTALGVSKLALLTPYTEEVSDTMRRVLAEKGVDTPVFGSFCEPVETRVARIDPASVREAAIKLGRDKGAEAVFMSCTNLRTLDILGAVEQAAGKPALSSNYVLFWDMLRSLDAKPRKTLGSLMRAEP